MSSSVKSIRVASRASPLALAQVAEIQALLPDLSFEVIAMKTMGDRDLQRSLRDMGKNNFFTKELDEALLEERCDIAIHSAKDLPSPLPDGLQRIALTKGVYGGDSLVLAEGINFYDLPPETLIATSSERREESVRLLRQDLVFCDLRGTIHDRLALIGKDGICGVVIAEAALIRLGLCHLNRIRLPGPTVEHQGRLAILARKGDREMEELFAPIDSDPHDPPYRRLYVGLTPPPPGIHAYHCPLITTKPRPWEENTSLIAHLPSYSHCLFTSKSAVHYLCELFAYYGLSPSNLRGKQLIAIGGGTAASLASYGLTAMVAQEATAEGVCAFLETLDLSQARLLWPRSALARPVIELFTREHNISCDSYILYDTETATVQELPNYLDFDEIVFSSPSTIAAFCELYGSLPQERAVRCYGPVTLAVFKTYQST